jgi:hypothetical protein
LVIFLYQLQYIRAYDISLAVDKIVIAQQSLQEFINALSPGAYSSVTKVNFKILDSLTLKPLGIYGSKEEIVRFLREIQAIDDITYVFAFRGSGKLTLRRLGQRAGIAGTTERTGRGKFGACSKIWIVCRAPIRVYIRRASLCCLLAGIYHLGRQSGFACSA